MHVDWPLVALVGGTLHPVEQLQPAEHLPRVLGQQCQQVELQGGKVYCDPAGRTTPGSPDLLVFGAARRAHGR